LCFAVRFSTRIDLGFPTLLNCLNSFTLFFLFCVTIFFGFDFNFHDCFYFFGQNFQLLFLLIISGVILVSRDFHKAKSIVKYEQDFLLICVIISAICLCFADDFLIFYLAIELQSLTFYILATFNRNSEFATEAGLKYFVFGAIISCFLLLGFSLFYLAFGSTSFELLFSLVISKNDPFFFAGMTFTIIALLFKLGSAPFHA